MNEGLFMTDLGKTYHSETGIVLCPLGYDEIIIGLVVNNEDIVHFEINKSKLELILNQVEEVSFYGLSTEQAVTYPLDPTGEIPLYFYSWLDEKGSQRYCSIAVENDEWTDYEEVDIDSINNFHSFINNIIEGLNEYKPSISKKTRNISEEEADVKKEMLGFLKNKRREMKGG